MGSTTRKYFGSSSNPDLSAPLVINVWGSAQTGHVWSVRGSRHNNPIEYIRSDVHEELKDRVNEQAELLAALFTGEDGRLYIQHMDADEWDERRTKSLSAHKELKPLNKNGMGDEDA